jgi:hypothetical protein
VIGQSIAQGKKCPRDRGSRDGIQEVGGSTPLSSTNEIRHYESARLILSALSTFAIVAGRI